MGKFVKGEDLAPGWRGYRESDWLYDPQTDDYVAVRKGLAAEYAAGTVSNERVDALLAEARTKPDLLGSMVTEKATEDIHSTDFVVTMRAEDGVVLRLPRESIELGACEVPF